jgi:hypothetical protein
MKVSESGTTWLMADGRTVSASDFVGRIENISVLWRGTRSGRLRDHETALVTSIMIMPHGEHIETRDLGTLEFRCLGRPLFQAPVASLMNRYHGLTKAAALTQRLRLLVDPSAALEDWAERCVFQGALPEPIHIGALLLFELHHVPPERFGSGMESLGFTVEIQALVRHKRDGDPPLGASFFGWK